MALLAVLAISCKKDREQTKMDLLTSGQWKIVAFTLSPPFDLDGDGDLDSDADAYALMDACEKDDLFIFKSDGKYEINEGGTKCDATDPQSTVYDWSFANGEKELIIDGDRVTIQELSSSRLKVSGNLFGVTADVTFQK